MAHQADHIQHTQLWAAFTSARVHPPLCSHSLVANLSVYHRDYPVTQCTIINRTPTQDQARCQGRGWGDNRTEKVPRPLRCLQPGWERERRKDNTNWLDGGLLSEVARAGFSVEVHREGAKHANICSDGKSKRRSPGRIGHKTPHCGWNLCPRERVRWEERQRSTQRPDHKETERAWYRT